MPRPTVVLILSVVLTSLVSAQNQPHSNSQAVAYAAQSIAALTGGATISDVTLTGSVTWNGSDTGTATLQALGTDDSRIDFSLNQESRSLIRNSLSGTPQGAWIGVGLSRTLAQHNCWTDANWFFPYFSLVTTRRPQQVFKYVGRETRFGRSVEHIRSYRYLGRKPNHISTFRRLSTMDYFLDASSFLPLAITFHEHPDNDTNLDTRIEIRFMNYESFNDILVPSRIQRLVNDGLVLDLTVTSASFNSGLRESNFQIR
jgi:hypothetical protein